jgi:GNAT superfamily N-acetyltransferase
MDVASHIIIQRIEHWPPKGFGELLDESETDGYRFLRRVANEWQTGANRFSRPGETLLAALVNDELVGICGVNIDPYLDDDRVGRLRNVYVLRKYRRQGVGGMLVRAAIAAAQGSFDRLRLRADEAAPARLYESFGFTPCGGIPHCTHVLVLHGSQDDRTPHPAVPRDE